MKTKTPHIPKGPKTEFNSSVTPKELVKAVLTHCKTSATQLKKAKE